MGMLDGAFLPEEEVPSTSERDDDPAAAAPVSTVSCCDCSFGGVKAFVVSSMSDFANTALLEDVPISCRLVLLLSSFLEAATCRLLEDSRVELVPAAVATAASAVAVDATEHVPPLLCLPPASVLRVDARPDASQLLPSVACPPPPLTCDFDCCGDPTAVCESAFDSVVSAPSCSSLLSPSPCSCSSCVAAAEADPAVGMSSCCSACPSAAPDAPSDVVLRWSS